MIPATLLKQKRNQHVEALERALAKIVAQFSCLPEVERIVLFGSYAAGRRDLFTDLDLLVVMSSELDFVHRTAEVYSQLTVDVEKKYHGVFDYSASLFCPVSFRQASRTTQNAHIRLKEESIW